MIKIAIETRASAFLPEAQAYKTFFERKGWVCNFVSSGTKTAGIYDVIVLFHGIHPFWNKYPEIVVGEYHSLSTGRFPRVKDAIKRLINKRASINIFLNERVRDALWFDSESPKNLLRGMGVWIDDSESLKNTKDFDIVYAGSFRQGLDKVILNLKRKGLKIAVAGFEGESCDLVQYFGKLDSSAVRRLIKKSSYGLNFTPDEWPYNIQDSTKVLEYLAARIPVITNKYFWINEFESARGARFVDLDSFLRDEAKLDGNLMSLDISDLDWLKVIDDSGVYIRLCELMGINPDGLH